MLCPEKGTLVFYLSEVLMPPGAGFLVLALVCFEEDCRKRETAEVREEGGESATPPGRRRETYKYCTVLSAVPL